VVLPQSVQFASALGGLEAGTGAAWSLGRLSGHLVELSAEGASAAVTTAVRLVWQAQLAKEPVAWVTTRARCFYPPDARDNGVDLDALAVVRVPAPADLGKACDMLMRSGAFGLVVVVGAERARFSDRQLTRLLGLARRHGTAVVFLTAKPAAAPSLGALVSVRAIARRERGESGFACGLTAIKDKRRAPGWRHQEVCRGPAGLR
jgi:recombination protein RecA